MKTWKIPKGVNGESVSHNKKLLLSFWQATFLSLKSWCFSLVSIMLFHTWGRSSRQDWIAWLDCYISWTTKYYKVLELKKKKKEWLSSVIMKTIYFWVVLSDQLHFFGTICAIITLPLFEPAHILNITPCNVCAGYVNGLVLAFVGNGGCQTQEVPISQLWMT